MEDKLKYSLLALSDQQSIWTRYEKRIWFLSLWLGTITLYANRTTMPLLMPAVAAERKWSKTDSGTVLSSFFWGYTLTQILGGYFSDKFGGQRVIYLAGLGWSFVTFVMPDIIDLVPKNVSWSIPFVVFIRIMNGAFQGIHFPSMMSLTSQNLSASERTSFFSMLTSGSAVGTVLTGTLGSFILDYFGWSSVFRVIGFMGIMWALFLRYFTMNLNRHKVVNLAQSKLGGTDNLETVVPWLRILTTKPSLWACILTHACEMNCFFMLLSWLPTYFHDTFPHAQGWVANMIPWIALPPCTLFGKLLTDHLIAKEWQLTNVRKFIQSLCFSVQILALAVMCRTHVFHVALFCMTVIIGASGFHNNSVTINPQDLAPNYSGSIFGLMNTVGAIPGFLGVYLAGHILELTQSWSAVFSTAIAINLFGWIIFTVFGSAKPLIKT